MKRKEKLDIKRIIELELWLLNNSSIIEDKNHLVEYFYKTDFTLDEIEYLCEAYNIPMAEIKEAIKVLDQNKYRIDELRFINDLAKKYEVDRDTIIRRIQIARGIDRYIQLNRGSVLPEQTVFNKLVRDNIPSIIESHGEKAVYTTLSSDEYWQCLIEKDKEELERVGNAKSSEEIKEELSDKLEVLKAMAEYHGYTLEDIIKASEEKRQSEGSFKRRIFLKSTYK